MYISTQSRQGPEEASLGEKAYTLELCLVSSDGTASVDGVETIHLQTSLCDPWDNVLCIVFPKENNPVGKICLQPPEPSCLCLFAPTLRCFYLVFLQVHSINPTHVKHGVREEIVTPT